MPQGIHHTAIICSDHEKSRYFYGTILGLTSIAENYRKECNSHKLDLKLPNCNQIELFSIPGSPKRPSYPEAQGLRHLAFVVSSVETFTKHLVPYS